MESTIASKLVKAFEEQFKTAKIDTKFFLEMLVAAEIPESSRFSEELPGKQQVINEGDRYHYLSLRRVLRNSNARNYELSGAKRIWAAALTAFGIYSSETLTRKIRGDSEL